jgi:hypothetical protein
MSRLYEVRPMPADHRPRDTSAGLMVVADSPGRALDTAVTQPPPGAPARPDAPARTGQRWTVIDRGPAPLAAR